MTDSPYAHRGWQIALVTAAALLVVLGTPRTYSTAVAATGTWHVDAFGDEVDAKVGDGSCRTAAGRCTLRAAVQEAARSQGADTIVLPAGRVEFGRANTWPLPSQTVDLEMSPARGDLDISGSLTVKGAGADKTTIDANGIDRAFSVLLGGNLTLKALTITGGDATTNDKTPADIAIGGAVLNNGKLAVDRVALVRNKADGGGGIFSIPLTNFTVSNSLIANNTAVEGGGIRIDGGARIVNSTITGNTLFHRPVGDLIPDEITGYGGGLDHRGTGNVTIINSTITNNAALKAGGGYSSGQGYTPVELLTEAWPYRTYVVNTVIAGNTVAGKADNCHVSSMVIVSKGHNLADDRSCFLTAAGDRPATKPKLGPLGSHGGPTRVQMPSEGSPLVNAGSQPDCPQNDQRGVARPRGPRCDIGAVER
jgi:hypothetical protein